MSWDQSLVEQCQKRNPDLDTIRLILVNGANPNMVQLRGQPLNRSILSQVCSTCPSMELINLLIDFKADVNLGTCPALSWILFSLSHMYSSSNFIPKKHIQSVQAILDAKANVNMDNIPFHGDKGNVLQEALRHRCHPQLVDLLLEHKADVSKPTQNGHSTLFVAVYSGCDSWVAKQLVKRGSMVGPVLRHPDIKEQCKEPTERFLKFHLLRLSLLRSMEQDKLFDPMILIDVFAYAKEEQDHVPMVLHVAPRQQDPGFGTSIMD